MDSVCFLRVGRFCRWTLPAPCFCSSSPFLRKLSYPKGTFSYSSPTLFSTSIEPRQFYRRRLPPSCIAFSSAEGRQIFKESLASGFMEVYFDLAPQIRTQVQPSYCGLSALVMVLNSFEVDPGRVWKAPWRWYHEDMLTCCLSSPQNLLTHGIVLEQFQAIAACNGLHTEIHRPGDTNETIDLFRSTVFNLSAKSLASSGTILVVSFDRSSLKQTGTGHYALIGGYHIERDLLLLLETASFKYPPHWAPLPSVWNGMRSIDEETGKPRGYMLVRKAYHHRLGFTTSGRTICCEDISSSSTNRSAHATSSLATNNQTDNGSGESDEIPACQFGGLRLFRISDAACQAFLSPISFLEPTSSGGRLRKIADDWLTNLENKKFYSPNLLNSCEDNGCCLSSVSMSSGQLPAHRTSDCILDKLFDLILSLLFKHKAQSFFFTCQPSWEARNSAHNSPYTQDFPQVVVDIIFSPIGRRAFAAMARLPPAHFSWLTTDGALKFDVSSYNTFGRAATKYPACELLLISDKKIRGTLLLTAFLLTFPYNLISFKFPSSSSLDTKTPPHHPLTQECMLTQLQRLFTLKCFPNLTAATQSELAILLNLISQLISASQKRSPLDSSCTRLKLQK